MIPVATRLAALEPFGYDLLQAALGMHRTRRRIGRALAGAGGGRVLDVGAGTGLYAAAVPPSAEYVAVDVDERKLVRLRARCPSAETVHADATALPFPDDSADYALCVALAHHLDENALVRLVDELARVVTQRLVFLEPLREDASRVSRLLWRLDRGSHARTESELLAALGRRFDVVERSTYRTAHRYLLCSAVPRREPAL